MVGLFGSLHQEKSDTSHRPDDIQKILKHLTLDQPDDPQNRSPPSDQIDYPTTLFLLPVHRIPSGESRIRTESEFLRQIAKFSITQLMSEATGRGILATPKNGDTFPNEGKGCLFVLTAGSMMLNGSAWANKFIYEIMEYISIHLFFLLSFV